MLKYVKLKQISSAQPKKRCVCEFVAAAVHQVRGFRIRQWKNPEGNGHIWSPEHKLTCTEARGRQRPEGKQCCSLIQLLLTCNESPQLVTAATRSQKPGAVRLAPSEAGLQHRCHSSTLTANAGGQALSRFLMHPISARS